MSFILANYKKQNENYQIADSQDFQATTYSDGYKKTSELTNADLSDAYQKNYQEASEADGSYLYKSAEWTNKQDGEGLITIKGKQVQELEDTSALYVGTMCYTHGLTEDILVKNISTLIKFYDRVDFVAINTSREKGIIEAHSFTPESTEDEIRTYVSETKASGEEYPHYTNSVPAAIEKYLFGNLGDEYVSEENLVNNPTAIYVSCDSFFIDNVISDGWIWGTEYAIEKYFNFISEYFAGRYFSMSQISQQSSNPALTVRYGGSKYDVNILNILLGILNPENYGEAELALDDEQLKKWEANTSDYLNLTYTNKKYAADFSYDKDFEEAGVQVITNCTIADTVQDYFEIVDVQALGGSDSMQTRVTGQNILFYDENYVCGNEVTIKIKVKLRDDVISHFDGFEDTNFGKATLSGSVNLSVDSPKLAPITTSYTVNYLEKGTNKVLHTAKTDNNVPINTQIKATDEVISIDGYNYDSADKATLTLGSGGNVLNLYYTKRTDLSYKVNYLEKGTNKVLSTQKVVNGQTFQTVITSANEAIKIDGYNYDSADKTTLTIGTGENVINLYYTKRTDLNYRVNYLEKGTNTEIKTQKVVSGQTYQAVITSANEVIDIDGYNYDSADKDTLTIGTGENVINLYYTKRTDLSYKVNYLEKGTNEVLSTQKVVNGQTFKAVITSVNEVITIYGYNYDSADKDTLTIGTGENVINLYYTKKDASVLVHHYIENTTERVPSLTKGQVVADETVTGKVNDQYKTSGSSNIANNYELVTSKLPTNATGVMTEEQIVVTYYYRLKTPTISSQNMTKNGTTTIEKLTDEITYNISYKVTLVDYIGDAEVTIVDTLAYPIDEAKSDLEGGTYNPTSKTITWVETIRDIDTYENQNNDIAINKTIKVVYTGINQGTTNIKNTVTGNIKTKTPEKEFEETTATSTTTTEFLVNIPVSKIWEDDNNKLGQRPTRVTFKLTGSDGSEYTKELAKPGTSGTTTTQDQSNPNRWNDIFENLPKYDSQNQEIKYTLTEINGELTYYEASLDSTGTVVTNTNKYGKVTVHYYIMNTDGTTTTTRVPDINGTEIPDVVIEGKEGEEYNTTWSNNVNEKYELVAEKLPANATGNIEKYNEEKPQEVIYYYRLKQAKVIINYLEKDTNQVLSPEEQIDGHVDDSYNTNTEHRKETIQKDGRTYTLVEDSGNTEGTITLEGIEVTYYYLQNTKATVRYVERDPETGEILKDLENPTTQEGLVGDKFVTNEKAFIGYRLVESPANKTITLGKEEQTLIYYYEAVYTGLIENHIDDKTGRVLYTEEHQIQVGREYNIPSKDFEGYDLITSKLPLNYTGTMGEDLVTVNYYYIKEAVLEVQYVDIYTNEPLTDPIIDPTRHEGDSYTTEEKVFENYDLVEVPSNANDMMKVETDENGNITDNKTIVIYYYTQRAIVEEHHIDSLTEEDIEEPTIHNGHVGDEYNIPAKDFLSYKLIEEDEEGNSMLPANSKGIMTAEKIVVNYYYNQPAKVIVHYVEKATGKELEETNSETGEVQSSQVTIEGFNQDEYTTEAKEFKYYTLIESPENKEGKMKVEIVEDEEGNQVVNNTIDVYYYYQAKPFNIGVEKEITGIVVNGETRTPTNGKLERVEIYRKDVEKTNIQIVYRIRVINSGEVEGAVTIEDKLPEGMNLVNDDGTWEEQDGILRKIIPEINPGETKEYTVVLNWNTAENNMGEKDNVINIVDTQNVPGFIDNNDKDNTSNANVIISVGTGELPIGLILALVALVGLETVTLRYAVVLTKRQKKKVNKK
ncbi:MAG: MucBP domain-containing protein [Clostridia bacterium]